MISVKDFGAVGDGRTDDTAAIQAAIDEANSQSYSEVVFIPAGDYRIKGPIVSTAETITIVGEGRRASKLVTTGGDFDVLSFGNNGNPVFGARLSNFQIRNIGHDKTGGSCIRFVDRAIECAFDNLDIRAYWQGLWFDVPARIVIDKVFFSCAARKAMAQSAIKIDDTSSEVQATGIHISNCESLANTSTLPSNFAFIETGSVDGLYITNCHVVNGRHGIKFEPQGSEVQDQAVSVLVSNVYFDKTWNSHVTFRGRVPGNFRHFQFANCQFRASQHNSIVFHQDDDLDAVSFSGCIFRLNQGSAILSAQGKHRVELNVTGCTFRNNNLGNQELKGDILYRGDGGTINGNTFIRGGRNGNAITLLSNSKDVMVSGNNLSQSFATTPILDHGNNYVNGNFGVTR